MMTSYQIRVDGGSPRTVVPFETVSYLVNGLAHGVHAVSLDGLPSTCDPGDNPRNVTLRGDDTALVVFSIECARTTGDVRVTVSTTGPDPDVGYNILLDGQTRGFVNGNGNATLPFVPAGAHNVSLGGVATNCSASAAQSVNVVAGATATANFTVTCAAAAVLRVAASMSGQDKDADGLLFRLDQGPTTRVGSSIALLRTSAGAHTWTLSDVQPNCTLGGPASGSVTIAPGDTVTINAALTCTAVGYGAAGTVTNDGVADTLANAQGNANAPHDILQLTTRYAPDWLIVVLRFARAVGSMGIQSPAGLQGVIDLDVDESVATGIPPFASAFGGTSQQGSDYAIMLFEATADGVRLLKTSPFDTTMHRVPFALEGDSVIIRIPLAKLGGDDGNLTITTIVGTADRPTDLAPNSGVIVARPASAPVAAARVSAPVPAAISATPAGKRSMAWPPRE